MNTIKNTMLTLAILLPSMAFAQDAGAGPSTFQGSYSLWGAIAIGIIASAITIFNAMKLGGAISKALWFFGIGMLLVVVGFMSVVLAWAPEFTQKMVHDSLFIIGYILMTLGGTSLYRLNKNIS